jgi:hypothetical protein
MSYTTHSLICSETACSIIFDVMEHAQSIIYIYIYIYIYITAIELAPSGSCTVHIYTQTVHNTEKRTYIQIKKLNIYTNRKLTNKRNAGHAKSVQVIHWQLH